MTNTYKQAPARRRRIIYELSKGTYRTSFEDALLLLISKEDAVVTIQRFWLERKSILLLKNQRECGRKIKPQFAASETTKAEVSENDDLAKVTHLGKGEFDDTVEREQPNGGVDNSSSEVDASRTLLRFFQFSKAKRKGRFLIAQKKASLWNEQVIRICASIRRKTASQILLRALRSHVLSMNHRRDCAATLIQCLYRKYRAKRFYKYKRTERVTAVVRIKVAYTRYVCRKELTRRANAARKLYQFFSKVKYDKTGEDYLKKGSQGVAVQLNEIESSSVENVETRIEELELQPAPQMMLVEAQIEEMRYKYVADIQRLYRGHRSRRHTLATLKIVRLAKVHLLIQKERVMFNDERKRRRKAAVRIQAIFRMIRDMTKVQRKRVKRANDLVKLVLQDIENFLYYIH